jgi:hypothetical protein
VQKAFKTLQGIIGYEISCFLEWPMLWAELGSNYPDKATFVPNVVGIITAWCDVLSARLEDNRFSTWADELVEKLETVRRIGIHIQVGVLVDFPVICETILYL